MSEQEQCSRCGRPESSSCCRDFIDRKVAAGRKAEATRAAEQLAGVGVGLSAEERQLVENIRAEIREYGIAGTGEGGNADSQERFAYYAFFDRLLASPPVPDYRAAIIALLDSDMPAGELRKALAEIVGLR